jgi:hypothetical protein
VTLPPEMLTVTRDDQLSGQCEHVRLCGTGKPKLQTGKPSPVDPRQNRSCNASPAPISRLMGNCTCFEGALRKREELDLLWALHV